MLEVYLSGIVLMTNNIVGLFVMIRFLNHVFIKSELKDYKRKFGLGLLLFVGTIMNVLIDNVGMNLVSILAFYYFIGYIFYQGKAHVKLIATVFIATFSFITELITALAFGMLFEASIQGVRDNPMHLFLGGVVSKILFIMLIEIIVRFRRRSASKVSLGSWLLIVSIPFVSIILAVISVYKPIINNSFDDLAVIACISILYINLIAFYLFDNIVIQIDDNNQIRYREKQLLLQQNQYQIIISGYNKVKRIRHDMLGHLIAINGYLIKSQNEEAIEYISRIHEDLDISYRGILSTNVAVDAIINNRMAKAEELGITFTHEIMIANDLQIDDIDLCIILGNILNNAIEGAQRVIKDIPLNINLVIKYKRNTLLIEVENTCDSNTINNKSGNYLSSKTHRRLNSVGTGLGNIKGVADKYNGFVKIDVQPERFSVRAMIPDIKSLD